jgi:hypothetical protein
MNHYKALLVSFLVWTKTVIEYPIPYNAENIPHPAEASKSTSANAEARMRHKGKNTIPMIDMVFTTDMYNSF